MNGQINQAKATYQKEIDQLRQSNVSMNATIVEKLFYILKESGCKSI